MNQCNRTTATDFYGPDQVLSELDRLKFAINSMVELTSSGSYLRENLDNIAKGVGARLDYLHDAVRIQAKQREAEVIDLQRTIARLRATREAPPPTECVA